MMTTRLPTHLINEIVAKARGDRQIINATRNEVPSPRGVADLQQFDLPSDADDDDDVATKAKKIRLFESETRRDDFINHIGYEFVKSVLEKTLTVMEHCHRLRVDPADVVRALEWMVPDISATMSDIVDANNADVMDVDESSDYDGSDGEVDDDDDDEASSIVDVTQTFDEAYPPVDGIAMSDVQFKDEVMMPIYRENFRISDSLIQRKARAIAALVKNATYAYLVAKLSDHYRILDQLEEASSLLELALWKAKIDKTTAGNVSEDEKARCRMACEANMVVPLVLPYLFNDVIARNRTDDWVRSVRDWARDSAD